MHIAVVSETFHYWMGVLKEAFWASLEAFETNPRLLFLLLLGSLITAALVYFVRGKKEFIEHIKVNIVLAFGGALITWFLVLIVIFAWEPLHLQKIAAANTIPDQCWMQNMTVPAPRDVPAAQSASETMLFCSYERKAPFFFVVDYDKDVMGYGPILFPEGRHISAQIFTKGSQAFYKIESPSILPFQIFVIRAYGNGQDAPIATKMRITPVDTEH